MAATLHSVIEGTKKLLKLGALSIVGIILLVILFRIGLIVKGEIFPRAPEEFQITFDKLPPIAFPESVTDKQISYSIETVDGELPEFPDRLLVYEIINKEHQLFDLQRAKNKMEAIGFNTKEEHIVDNLYHFDKTEGLPASLEMDIVSEDFKLRSNFFISPIVIAATGLPNEDRAKGEAINFFSSMNLFPSDIEKEQTESTLLSIQGKKLVRATSFAKSQIVRVDFYQKGVIGNDVLDPLPILYPNPPSSSINVHLASRGEGGAQVVQADFYHQTISNAPEDASTYPIKTAGEAFAELEEGKAYIAADFLKTTNVAIRNIYLAYYAGETLQDYLMPIVVFQGEGDSFFAYVSAVRNNCIGNTEDPCDKLLNNAAEIPAENR
ncbi:MAG: hypothetical protein HY431_00770 [Candidatus Levybacteria bacterium]|nr:hypothetical protein [Candidatus Levybacteria bacterium]